MKKKVLIIAAAAAAIAAVIVAVCIFGSSKAELVQLSQAEIDAADVTLISHRGLAALAAENTLEAAEKAAEKGYTSIEFDIRRTKDGIWVLMHDADIKRTTDGKGEVSQMTYKEILKHRIDTGNGIENYELVTVPTLESMLKLCQELKLTPVIEIKQDGTDHMLELLNTIATHRNSDFSIISFDREQLEEIDDILTQGKTTMQKGSVSLCWLTSTLDENVFTQAAADKSITVSFNGNKAGTAEEIKKFQKAGLKLATWTIDSPERLKELYSLGVSCFTTNLILP